MRTLTIICCFVGTFISGCAAQRSQLEEGLHAARDVAEVAKPCLVAAQDMAEARCAGDARCIDGVRESFEPSAKALNLFHTLWCGISPDSEGCEKGAGAEQ